MSDKRHLEILKDGQKTWNLWRRRSKTQVPDLTEASLKEYMLKGGDFSRALLVASDLRSANASGADFRNAKLERATLQRAKLADAKLSNANLREASLHRAQGVRARFDGAKLVEATLLRANLRQASFRGANLSQANLLRANLASANFRDARMTQVYLVGANLENADFSGADLRGAFVERRQLRTAKWNTKTSSRRSTSGWIHQSAAKESQSVARSRWCHARPKNRLGARRSNYRQDIGDEMSKKLKIKMKPGMAKIKLKSDGDKLPLDGAGIRALLATLEYAALPPKKQLPEELLCEPETRMPTRPETA